MRIVLGDSKKNVVRNVISGLDIPSDLEHYFPCQKNPNFVLERLLPGWLLIIRHSQDTVSHHPSPKSLLHLHLIPPYPHPTSKPEPSLRPHMYRQPSKKKNVSYNPTVKTTTITKESHSHSQNNEITKGSQSRGSYLVDDMV